MTAKTNPGNFFEDFRLGREIRHATPRTVSEADGALYLALTGTRFAVNSSDEFARTLGFPRAPLDDFLVFHLVFGKTVPEVSLNAIANLGYAECRFLKPVFAGDTLYPALEVDELSPNRTSGVVGLRSTVHNQRRELVLEGRQRFLLRKRTP